LHVSGLQHSSVAPHVSPGGLHEPASAPVSPSASFEPSALPSSPPSPELPDDELSLFEHAITIAATNANDETTSKARRTMIERIRR
jgi:hypothetical protein